MVLGGTVGKRVERGTEGLVGLVGKVFFFPNLCIVMVSSHFVIWGSGYGGMGGVKDGGLGGWVDE